MSSLVVVLTVLGLPSLLLSYGAVFDVRNFGAKGDGHHKDTIAIRETFEACRKASGGMVIFPALGQYLTGAFNVSSNTVVYIEKDAAILGSTDGKDYPLIQPLPVIFAPWVPLINSYYTEAFGFAYNTSN
jgi:polygalacturonase